MLNQGRPTNTWVFLDSLSGPGWLALAECGVKCANRPLKSRRERDLACLCLTGCGQCRERDGAGRASETSRGLSWLSQAAWALLRQYQGWLTARREGAGRRGLPGLAALCRRMTSMRRPATSRKGGRPNKATSLPSPVSKWTNEGRKTRSWNLAASLVWKRPLLDGWMC